MWCLYDSKGNFAASVTTRREMRQWERAGYTAKWKALSEFEY